MKSGERGPLISVVMPVYNTEKFLPAALDSLVEQTYQNLEVILVNNGSKGNVKNIYETYKSLHPVFQWKLVNFEENIGLYHARVRGYEQATGDYLATMDSDDTISVDFYYQLQKKALETDSDIVMAEYVNVNEDGTKDHLALNPMELTDVCWEGEECLRQFFRFRGGCFNLHALWIKLYKKDLWKVAQADLQAIKSPLVLSEDILASTIFFAYAKKVVNIHGAYYYHFLHSKAASINLADSEEKFLGGIRQQKFAFDQIECFLKEIGRYDEVREDVYAYRKFLYDVFLVNLNWNGLPAHINNALRRKTREICGFEQNKNLEITCDDLIEEDYFQHIKTPFNDGKEEAYRKILDKKIRCVSFDIFDTLLERPFLEPDDLFEFLSMEYNRLPEANFISDFAKLRREFEGVARQRVTMEHPGWKEVQLSEIYDEMVSAGVLNAKNADSMMQKELELELRFCKPRKVGKELYDFALRTGKQIVCTSDMYLPCQLVDKLLKSGGYTKIDKIFLSSEERACKYDGALFTIALHRLNLKASQVLHIGDNYNSDILVPQRKGIQTVYTSSATEQFKNRNFINYTGSNYLHVFGGDNDPAEAHAYLAMRCMAGLVKNKYFSDPFITFAEETQFNADPRYMGYYALGMYYFSIARWLMESTQGKYDVIHFISRDGYYIKRAYDILTAQCGSSYPRSHYLYSSRNSTLPLMISKPEDICTLENLIDIKAYTPMEILARLEVIIPSTTFENRKKLLGDHHILQDKTFDSVKEWYVFTKVFKTCFYDPKTIDKYRTEMKSAFQKMIGTKDCTFDVGYSARTEAVFTKLLGCKLDGFYLYFNLERGRLLAQKLGIEINTFHPECADIQTILLTETFISSMEPSVKGYELKNGLIKPILKNKQEFNEQTRFVLRLIQNSALDFVEDMVNTFPREWLQFVYRPQDAARPFRSLLRVAGSLDRSVFNIAYTKDDDSSYSASTLQAEWDMLCATHQGIPSSPDAGYDAWISSSSKWKRGVFWLLYDRRTLKVKTKEKLAHHPILKGIAKGIYALPRSIYHLFKR